ncbi:uncharacterized protein LOC133493900 isoform X2 [Syngnathoides biaculeatus]|uniref:uncharacterized protein LOC133493900 isoform X2 n=1 Tax=Syngnathoides biaculeatus TaxID=300417 RepID=UPI002ADD6556|nr:uncharacterized protein LOC133493900 isoform X2 [Syngnathoides biaculeatus]
MLTKGRVWNELFSSSLRPESFCDHRVKMCARSTAEYKEDIWGAKEEKKRQRRLLDVVFHLQPRIVLRRAGLDSLDLREADTKEEIQQHLKTLRPSTKNAFDGSNFVEDRIIN